MSAAETPEPEAELVAQLVACDEALAAGDSSSIEFHGDVATSDSVRLKRNLACVNLLRRLWPRRADELATSAAEAAPSGRRIGRFQVLRELGAGGFGIVLLARDPHLRRDVALKVPRSDVILSVEMRARFQQEARAAAVLDHSNIVGVYEAGEVGPVCYIASAYCPGVTLAEWLHHQNQLVPHVDAARLAHILADAVQHAHGRGIIHRDLKPGNILLSNAATRTDGEAQEPVDQLAMFRAALHDLTPRITDFGLARFVHAEGQLTKTGAAMGTPSYMAPEQAEGRTDQVTAAIDVYGLGAILYETLTGRPPFLAESAVATLLLVCREEPLPPSRLHPGLPVDLETICLKCLQKEPARRYASAAALAEDLRRFLHHEPIMARPVSRAERTWRWCRRNAKVASLLLAMLIVLLTGASGVVWQWLRAEATAEDLVVERDHANREKLRAERHWEDARGAVVQLNELGETLVNSPGMQKSGQDVLERVVTYYEGFLHESSADPQVRFQAAYSCERLARIRHMLGQWKQADQAFQRQRELLENLLDLAPDHVGYLEALAYGLHSHANLLRDMDRREAAIEAYRRADGVMDQLVRAPQSGVWRKALYANLLVNYATMLDPAVDSAQLEKLFSRALEVIELGIAEDPEYLDLQLQKALCLESLAMHQFGQKRFAEAEANLLESRDIRLRQHRRGKAGRDAEQYLARSYAHLGKVYAATQRPELAETAHHEAVRIMNVLISDFPQVPIYRGAQVGQLVNLADCLDHATRGPERLRLYREAIVLLDRVAAELPLTPHYRERLADLLIKIPALSQPTDDHQEFARMALSGVSHFDRWAADESLTPEQRTHLFKRYRQFANLLIKLGEDREVEAQYRKVLRLDSSDPDANNALAWWLATRPDVAARNPAEAVEKAKSAVAERPENANYWNTLGVAQYRAGLWKEAIENLDHGDQMRQGDKSWDHFFQAMCRWQLGDRDLARDHLVKAIDWMKVNAPESPELARYRAEAEALIGTAESP